LFPITFGTKHLNDDPNTLALCRDIGTISGKNCGVFARRTARHASDPYSLTDFQVRAHTGTKETPVYMLVVAKGGRLLQNRFLLEASHRPEDLHFRRR
jgi:hypothetical protein